VDPQIRRARPEEAERLSEIAFSAKAHWKYPARWLELWKPKFAFSSHYFQENESWVAEEDSRPVAFYTLQERDGKAWLENLWVSPEFIGKGIGKKLFLHAADLSRERGFRVLQLEADPNAAGFYEKMGMCKVGEKQSEIDSQLRILPIMEIQL